MLPGRLALLSGLLACGVITAATGALAQECPEPPRAAPLEATPASGATGVTLDAVLRVRYAPGYFAPGGPGDDPARNLDLGLCAGSCGAPCALDDATPVAGLIQVHGDELVFVPDEPLLPRAQYVARALGVDGDLEVSFCTGSRFDVGAPTLGAIDREAPVLVGPQCGLPDGGYRVGIYFEPATDDGPLGSIEYLLYLTRGEGVDAPRLVGRARNYRADQITMSLLLAPELGSTPVCVQLAAVDGVGNVTVNEERHCFDPITRTWFYGGCSIGGAGRGPSDRRGPLSIALAGSLWLGLRARRRRR